MTRELTPLYKATILVIDDTPDNLHLLTEMLTKQGYKIRIIPNGRLALKAVLNNPPDLILLDIVMPGLDGFQVCRQLKNHPNTQSIPVIFLSGLNETFDKVKAFEVGGVDYITKPFQVKEVLARIENQLRLQRLQCQLSQQNIRLKQEIQERQQAEMALRESEKKYRHLVEASQDFIWSVDRNGYYTFVNPVVQNVYGYSPEEMLGHPFTDFLSPECLESDRHLFQRLLQGTSVFQYETTHLSKTGEPIQLLLNAIALIDAQGQVVGVTGTASDITERQRAQEELRLSEENLAQAQRIAHIGNWEFNVITSQISWSAELFRIFGLEPNQTEPSYQQLLDFIHPDDRCQFEETVKQAIAQGLCYELEFKILPKNRTTVRHLEVRIEPIFDENHQVIKLFGTALDISQRKKSETALRESELRERERAYQLQLILDELKRTQSQLVQTAKMSSLGQMIAGIAHEINNPAAFILGNIAIGRQYFSDLIRLIQAYQETYPDSPTTIQNIAEDIDLEFIQEDWHKLLNSIQEGAERIHHIILSLRNFSRLDEAEIKTVDIHQGLDSTLFILQHRLKSPGNRQEIQIIKDYGQLPKVTCYANQLNQVFINILTNAIEAIDSYSIPGVIKISTEAPEAKGQDLPNNGNSLTDRVRIQITDNGIGIPEDLQPQIFDPFFTTKQVGSGTGLGLSISYQIIVEKHQGQLTCESTPEKGTTFTIELPIQPRSQNRDIDMDAMDLAKEIS